LDFEGDESSLSLNDRHASDKSKKAIRRLGSSSSDDKRRRMLMTNSNISEIMAQYDSRHALLEDFTNTLADLIRDILRASALNVHSVTCRTKERTSIEAKLNRAPNKYLSLEDVTDVCGVRIITLFADDVDIVGKLVAQEFDVDVQHSIDKRKSLGANQFGYLSLHYVVRLNPVRRRLSEYKSFCDCSAEVQIRSMLQHAWAEIEHDLGYKAKETIPTEIRRKFSQLAGILESADDQFSDIRRTLAGYDTALPGRIVHEAETVRIDKASLSAYIQLNTLVVRTDARITTLANARYVVDEQWIATLVPILRLAGFNTIGDLNSRLSKLEDILFQMETCFFIPMQFVRSTVQAGTCLVHFSYVEVVSTQGVVGLRKFINASGIGDEKPNKRLAQEIFDAYEQSKKKLET